MIKSILEGRNKKYICEDNDQTPLGEGGQGKVFRIREIRKKRYYALKILNDNSNLNLLEQEISFLQKATHNNIVPMLDASIKNEEGESFILMDYMKHGDIIKYMKVNKALPIREKLIFIQEIAGALKYIHKEGYIHRDVKPSNIFITDNGGGEDPYACLGDFGIVKKISKTNEKEQGKGSYMYLPLEILQRNESHNKETDIYGLGMSMYRIIAEKHPCKDLSHYVENMKKSTPFANPSIYNSSVKPKLDQICLKAIAHKKKDRYQSLDHFLEDLTLCLELYPNYSEDNKEKVQYNNSLIINSKKENIASPKHSGTSRYLKLGLVGLVLGILSNVFYWNTNFSEINKKHLNLTKQYENLPKTIEEEKNNYYEEIEKYKTKYENEKQRYDEKVDVFENNKNNTSHKISRLENQIRLASINNLKKQIVEFSRSNLNQKNWKAYITYENDLLKDIERAKVDNLIKEKLKEEVIKVKYNNIYNKIIEISDNALNFKKISEENKEFYYFLSKNLLALRENEILKQKTPIRKEKYTNTVERLGDIFKIYILGLENKKTTNISSENREAKYKNTINLYNKILSSYLNVKESITTEKIIESYEDMIQIYMFFSKDKNKFKNGKIYFHDLNNLLGKGGLSAIGDIYLTGGYGITKNPEKAIDYYKKAIDAGNGLAAIKLGTLYSNDTEIDKDIEKSKKYYKKAIILGLNANMLIGHLYEINKNATYQDIFTIADYIKKSIRMYEKDKARIYIKSSIFKKDIDKFYSLEDKVWQDEYRIDEDHIAYFKLGMLGINQHVIDFKDSLSYFEKAYKHFIDKDPELNLKKLNKYEKVRLADIIELLYSIGKTCMNKGDFEYNNLAIQYFKKFGDLVDKIKEKNNNEEGINWLEGDNQAYDIPEFNVNSYYEDLDRHIAVLYESSRKSINAEKFYQFAIAKGYTTEYRVANTYQKGQFLNIFARLAIGKYHKKALEWHEKAIKKGFFTSLFQMAQIFEFEDHKIKANYSDAKNCYLRAAEKGFHEALVKIGELYEKGGPGIKKNPIKAYEYYSEYAKKKQKKVYEALGDFHSTWGFHLLDVRATNTKKARKWYQKGIEQGELQAYLKMGELYEKYHWHFFLEKNEERKKPIFWYKKYAKQVSNDLYGVIGQYYEQRKAVIDKKEKDYIKAKEYYEKGVTEGYYKNLLRLSLLYKEGIGVKKDYSIAVKYYDQAIEKEIHTALLQAGELYETGGHGLNMNHLKAREYYQKAIEIGLRKGKKKIKELDNKIAKKGDKMMGIYYVDLCDYEKGDRYFKRYANQDPEKILEIIQYYHKKSKKDIKTTKKLFSWHLKGVKLGDSRFMISLGSLYEKGKSTKENYRKAKEWYSEAAKEGNNQALFDIGRLYVKGGIGLEKDLKQAEEYFEKYVNKESIRAYKVIGDYYQKEINRNWKDNEVDRFIDNKVENLVKLRKEYSEQAIKWYTKWEEKSGKKESYFLIGKLIISQASSKETYYEQELKKLIESYNAPKVNSVYLEKRIVHLAKEYEYNTQATRNQRYKKAEEWFQKYSKNSGINSINIGNFYNNRYMERKIKKDYKEAIRWYKIAENQGEKLRAKENIDNLNFEMSKIEYQKLYKN